ncbi:hypothetical protein, partial [Paracoccus ravus]|uniref:hypothetical protein n=1 Tax=Paracoccus ravus TaxID=2447760 RepID=UPI00142FCF08
VRRKRFDRKCRDRSDTRHGLSTACRGRVLGSLAHLEAELYDALSQLSDMSQKHLSEVPDADGQGCVDVFDWVRKLPEVGTPSRRDQAVFGKMSAKSIDHLSALPDKHLPRPKQRGASLLPFRLQRDKSHRRYRSSGV